MSQVGTRASGKASGIAGGDAGGAEAVLGRAVSLSPSRSDPGFATVSHRGWVQHAAVHRGPSQSLAIPRTALAIVLQDPAAWAD